MESFPGLNEGSLDSFLDFLYDGLSGHVIIGELQNNGSKTWVEHTAYEWPNQRDRLKSHIVLGGREKNVYIAPAVFSNPAPTKENFKASNVAWAEYDSPRSSSEQDNKGSVPSESSLGESSDSSNGEPLPNNGTEKGAQPTLRVSSSSGKEHHYYRMIQPFDKIEELEQTNRAIAYKTGADKSGWDATQLLRPIQTFNYKYEQPYQVRVIAYTATDFPRGILDQGFTLPETNGHITIPKILPSVADVMLKYSFPQSAIDLLTKKEVKSGEETGGQGRSAALMALGYELAEVGLSAGEIYALLNHKDKAWGKFYNRPDKKQRYTDIIRIAKEKYPSAKEEEMEAKEPGSELLVLGWNSLRNYKIEFDWVLEGMFLENTLNILGGKPGTGKTQLSIRFGENLALGREQFLGFPIPKQRKVLFLSLELNIIGVKMFQELMAKSLTEEEQEILDENFLIVPVGNPIDLTSPHGQTSLDYLIREWEPEVVIVDSMGSSVPGGLSKEDRVSELLWYNDKLNNRGISTWFISHPRKSEAAQSQTRKPSLDDLFGNVFQAARARGIYGLHDPKKESKLELITLKQSFAKDDGKSKYLARDGYLNFALTDPPKKAEPKPKNNNVAEEVTEVMNLYEKPSETI